mmetsp:Transcript_39956/g.111030  ORF Transcript_39956/g.111030 Transcript_39956/m.111030 type:complete len:258 (-) Transcript_39956:832-1605(-)
MLRGEQSNGARERGAEEVGGPLQVREAPPQIVNRSSSSSSGGCMPLAPPRRWPSGALTSGSPAGTGSWVHFSGSSGTASALGSSRSRAPCTLGPSAALASGSGLATTGSSGSSGMSSTLAFLRSSLKLRLPRSLPALSRLALSLIDSLLSDILCLPPSLTGLKSESSEKMNSVRLALLDPIWLPRLRESEPRESEPCQSGSCVGSCVSGLSRGLLLPTAMMPMATTISAAPMSLTSSGEVPKNRNSAAYPNTIQPDV